MTKDRSGVVCESAVTDHALVMIGLTDSILKPERKSRLVTKLNFDSIAHDLADTDWSMVLSVTDASLAAQLFTSKINNIVEQNTEQIKISRRKFNLKPWMTPGLIRCTKNRDALHSKARARPNDAIIQITYKRYRNFYKHLLDKLKREHERIQLELNKRNPKKLWQTIKDICHSRKGSNTATELTKIYANTKYSLDKCNEYFSTIGDKLAQKILGDLKETEDSLAKSVPGDGTVANSFFIAPTDVSEVSTLIQELKEQSAPGLDNISNRLIKHIKKHIILPLTHIINLSIETGAFPECWKNAALCPIYKSGNKLDPANYRPISLLTSLSKLLERVMNMRLMQYLESKQLLNPNQFGFRQARSTVDAVGSLSNCIVNALDSGKACIGVFLDLAKAFDTVSVKILLRKMELLGIRGIALEWFQTYLSNRSQRIKIGNNISSERYVRYGVPQGSILGPSLFLIYINDITSSAMKNAELFCYADDTAMIFSDNSWMEVHKKAEQGMSRLGSWLKKNLLTLNTDKTKYIAFHKTNASKPLPSTGLVVHCCAYSDDRPIICSCPKIARTTSIKYLGVTIDEKMNFKEHIHILSGKVRKLIHFFKPLRYSADISLLKQIYIAICQNLICYCLPVWGGAAKTVLIELERAQRSVLKVILRKKRRFPTRNIYEELEVPTVRQLFIEMASVLTHKNLTSSSILPSVLARRVYKVPVKATHTTFAQRHSGFLHPFIYNNICKACNLKNKSVREAKQAIRVFLLSLNYDQTEKLIAQVA